MTTDFPDDETEFGRQWSSAAGELNGLKRAIAEAEKRSGEMFVRRRDAEANALRDLAVFLGHERDAMSKRVGEFIEEDGKRNYIRRKALGI